MNVLKNLSAKCNISWMFCKFLVTGAINTLFGYCIFALFIFLNFHYTLATLLATILGIFFNFKTTGIIVFKNRKNKLFFKFILVYGFMYLVTIVQLSFLKSIHMDNMYINYAIAILPNAMLSYFIMKKVVFKEKHTDI